MRIGGSFKESRSAYRESAFAWFPSVIASIISKIRFSSCVPVIASISCLVTAFCPLQ